MVRPVIIGQAWCYFITETPRSHWDKKTFDRMAQVDDWTQTLQEFGQHLRSGPPVRIRAETSYSDWKELANKYRVNRAGTGQRVKQYLCEGDL